MWESKFHEIVSGKDQVQDMNNNQLKLEVHDTYKRDEKLTTNFEPSDDIDVIDKIYLNEELLKINGHLSFSEKDYNDFKLQNNKQTVATSIQRAVKTNIQILYDKILFDAFPNPDEVLKDLLFVTRRRPDLEEVNDDIV